MSQDNEILDLVKRQKLGRRTQITIETHTTTVIRATGDGLRTAYCPGCKAVAADLSAADAAAILGLGESEITLFQNTGELHLTEAGGLCGNALVEHAKHAVPTDNKD